MDKIILNGIDAIVLQLNDLVHQLEHILLLHRHHPTYNCGHMKSPTDFSVRHNIINHF